MFGFCKWLQAVSIKNMSNLERNSGFYQLMLCMLPAEQNLLILVAANWRLWLHSMVRSAERQDDTRAEKIDSYR